MNDNRGAYVVFGQQANRIDDKKSRYTHGADRTLFHVLLVNTMALKESGAQYMSRREFFAPETLHWQPRLREKEKGLQMVLYRPLKLDERRSLVFTVSERDRLVAHLNANKDNQKPIKELLSKLGYRHNDARLAHDSAAGGRLGFRAYRVGFSLKVISPCLPSHISCSEASH